MKKEVLLKLEAERLIKLKYIEKIYIEKLIDGTEAVELAHNLFEYYDLLIEESKKLFKKSNKNPRLIELKNKLDSYGINELLLKDDLINSEMNNIKKEKLLKK